MVCLAQIPQPSPSPHAASRIYVFFSVRLCRTIHTLKGSAPSSASNSNFLTHWILVFTYWITQWIVTPLWLRRSRYRHLNRLSLSSIFFLFHGVLLVDAFFLLLGTVFNLDSPHNSESSLPTTVSTPVLTTVSASVSTATPSPEYSCPSTRNSSPSPE